jgi:hypothetical protein
MPIMLSEARYKTIVRASAVYDLVVTAAFTTPWTLTLTLDLFQKLHTMLGLPGTIPGFEPTHLLFGGLMGSVVVVWSLARLRLNLAVLGRYDAAARALFALWQIYAVASGASPLLLAFTLFEIAFGIAQALPYRGDSAATPLSSPGTGLAGLP